MRISNLHLPLTTITLLMGTGLGLALEIKTNPYVARGATFALGRISIDGGTINSFSELGFCWSKENKLPTIEDTHGTECSYLTEYRGDYGYIYIMRNLEPSSIYYIRAYGIRKANGKVLYGDPVKIVTIPRGQVTWNYATGPDATEETDMLLKSKIEEAVNYWNMATSITGFHADVHYVPEVPTADCSYGGYIRVGNNSGSHRTGTIMHEMNHGIGVGQHAMWYGYEDHDSPFREKNNSGDWLGRRTSRLVNFLTNGEYSHLTGDKVHMWPFGINGGHEDTHQEILYLAQALVTQALGEDGLPIKDRFHSPAYVFDFDEDRKYYLKPEAEEYGALTHFVAVTKDGVPDSVELTKEEALADDRAAWYLEFDLQTQFYRFRNVATGRYLSCNPSDAQATLSSEPSEWILTESIETVTTGDYEGSTFWISDVTPTQTPKSLIMHPWNGFSVANWSCSPDYSRRQRWHILTSDDLCAFSGQDAAVETIDTDSGAPFPADTYDIAGRVVRRDASGLDGLAPGIYIVKGRKIRI